MNNSKLLDTKAKIMTLGIIIATIVGFYTSISFVGLNIITFIQTNIWSKILALGVTVAQSIGIGIATIYIIIAIICSAQATIIPMFKFLYHLDNKSYKWRMLFIAIVTPIVLVGGVAFSNPNNLLLAITMATGLMSVIGAHVIYGTGSNEINIKTRTLLANAGTSHTQTNESNDTKNTITPENNEPYFNQYVIFLYIKFGIAFVYIIVFNSIFKFELFGAHNNPMLTGINIFIIGAIYMMERSKDDYREFLNNIWFGGRWYLGLRHGGIISEEAFQKFIAQSPDELKQNEQIINDAIKSIFDQKPKFFNEPVTIASYEIIDKLTKPVAPIDKHVEILKQLSIPDFITIEQSIYPAFIHSQIYKIMQNHTK